MPAGGNQVSIALSHEATASYHRLTPKHRAVVNRQLRALAMEPERAPIRGLSPEGRRIYVAQAMVNDGNVKGYRIDFVIDEVMQARAGIPAIAVWQIKALWR